MKNKNMSIFLLVSFLWAGPALAKAEKASDSRVGKTESIETLLDYEEKTKAPQVSLMKISFQIFCSLLLILALIGGGVWFLKNIIGLPESRSTFVEVIGQAPIGGKKYISIIKVAGKALVLGVSETNITMLDSLPASLFPEEEQKGPHSQESFKALLAEKLKRIVPGS